MFSSFSTVSTLILTLLIAGCSPMPSSSPPGTSTGDVRPFATVAFAGTITENGVPYSVERLQAVAEAHRPPSAPSAGPATKVLLDAALRKLIETNLIGLETKRRNIEKSDRYHQALFLAVVDVQSRFLYEAFMAEAKFTPEEINQAAEAERAAMRGDMVDVEVVAGRRFAPKDIEAAKKTGSIEAWVATVGGARVMAKKGDLRPAGSLPPEVAGEIARARSGELVGPLLFGHGQILFRVIRYEKGSQPVDEARVLKMAELRLRRTVGQNLFEVWKKNALAAVKIEYAPEFAGETGKNQTSPRLKPGGSEGESIGVS